MWKRIIAAGVLMVAAAPCPPQAATCAAEIDLLARQYNLPTKLPRAEPPAGTAPEAPATTESRGVPPEALSQSGGVIEPPEQGRTVTIEPPRTGDTMPTAPPVPPQTAERPSQSPTELSAAKRMRMQSLLDAARAADREGREAECFERLGEARAVPEPG
jgi:hypothetical protein